MSEFTPDQILPLSRSATRRPSEYRTIDALCKRLGVAVTEPYAPADEIMHRLLDRIEALERDFDQRVIEAIERHARSKGRISRI